MMPRISLRRFLAGAGILAIVVVFFLQQRERPISGETDDLDYVYEVLQENNIPSKVAFASRTVRCILDAPDRPITTVVDQNLLLEPFSHVSVKQGTRVPVGEHLDLHVKKSLRPDDLHAGGLIFGVSTTFERFSDEATNPIKEWRRWLTAGQGHSNDAGLVLSLYNASASERDEVARQLLDVGISATVVLSDPELDMAGRYVALVSLLYHHQTSSSRDYFVLIDDDTFFPAMSSLLHTLSAYDPSKPFYIGTFTERADWMVGNRAPMAYGGAGVILTTPVARTISELPCLQKNNESQYIIGGDQGDRLLYNCIKTYTEVALTHLPSLHQEDQMGDPSGFYESGQQPLSLHHYKSWHHVAPEKMHVIADACGEDSVLQRFQFKDDFIISNGYSVAHYPKGIDFDLLHIEGTMVPDYGNDEALKDVVFSYSFGMLRKNLSGTGRKQSWELVGSKREDNGRVRQVYLKRKGDRRWLTAEEDEAPRDSVILLTWIP